MNLLTNKDRDCLYQLNINDEDHSIYGFKLNPSEYQRLKFVITNEYQQGWRPTKAEIRSLIRSDRYPELWIQRDIKKLDQLMIKDR